MHRVIVGSNLANILTFMASEVWYLILLRCWKIPLFFLPAWWSATFHFAFSLEKITDSYTYLALYKRCRNDIHQCVGPWFIMRSNRLTVGWCFNMVVYPLWCYHGLRSIYESLGPLYFPPSLRDAIFQPCPHNQRSKEGDGIRNRIWSPRWGWQEGFILRPYYTAAELCCSWGCRRACAWTIVADVRRYKICTLPSQYTYPEPGCKSSVLV